MRRALLAVAFIACTGPAGPAAPAAQATPQPSGSVAAAPTLADTWTFDGTTWTKRAVSGPPARRLAALVYDEARRAFLLFGGETATSALDDTWSWDGHVWKVLHPVHHPPPRGNAAIGFDPGSGRVLLFGGLVPGRATEGDEDPDTWAWDGIDWHDLGPATGPGSREGSRMVNDGHRLLLVGGRHFSVAYHLDVWAWDADAWVPVAPDAGRGRAEHVAVAAAPDTILVFGGTGQRPGGGPGEQGVPLADTWLFRAGRWTAGPAGPPALGSAVAIQAGGRTQVLGGYGCPNLSDASWSWDGSAWSHGTAAGLAPRWGAAAGQDPTTGRALLFGGSTEPNCIG